MAAGCEGDGEIRVVKQCFRLFGWVLPFYGAPIGMRLSSHSNFLRHQVTIGFVRSNSYSYVLRVSVYLVVGLDVW